MEAFINLFFCFIIYSFIGWIVEIICVYVLSKKIVNRGFLIGPYCPVHGFGYLILLLVFEGYAHDPITFFVIFAVAVSILEYTTSYLLEKVFNARWWDYSNSFLNINGRISLFNSIGFGILGCFAAYVLNPLITYGLSFVNSAILFYISLGTIIIFLVDVLISFGIMVKLKNSFVLLNKDMTSEIKEQALKVINNNRLVKSFPLIKDKHIKK